MTRIWKILWLDSTPGIKTDAIPSLQQALSTSLHGVHFDIHTTIFDKIEIMDKPDLILWNPYGCRSALHPLEQVNQLKRDFPNADVVLCTDSQRLSGQTAWTDQLGPGFLADVVTFDFSQQLFIDLLVDIIKHTRFRAIIVSDLHFGPSQHTTSDQHTAFEFVRQEVSDFWNPLKPEALLICGDLTSKGEWEEFRESRDFLVDTVKTIGFSATNVGIVPGNHDINRKESEGKRLANFVEFLQQFYRDLGINGSELREKYPLAPEGLWQRPSRTDFKVRDLLSITQIEWAKVCFVGLISVIDDPERFPIHKWDCGAIELEGMRSISIRLDKNVVRFGFTHHHFLPVPDYFQPEQDLATLNIGYVLERLLDFNFTGLFHGHTHFASGWLYQKILTSNNRTTNDSTTKIYIFGTGSQAAAEVQEVQPFHHYFVLRGRRTTEKGSRQFCVESRYFDSQVGKWTTGPLRPGVISV